jgi:exopolysaccharide biosynthesis polyprenyl glycosylphosphotransferase
MQGTRAGELDGAPNRSAVAARWLGIDPPALRRIHVYTDVAAVSAAWLGSWALRDALTGTLGPVNAFETYVQALPLIVPPWILSCWFFGIYASARGFTVIEEIRALLRGALLGLLVVSTLGFFFRELEFGRSVVLLAAGASTLLQGASRALFRRLERRLRASGLHDVRTLIVGGGASGIRLFQRIADHPEIGYRVVGFVDDAGARAPASATRPVLGGLRDLRRLVESERIDEVVVAIPSLEHARLLSLVLDCEGTGAAFRMVTGLFDVLTSSSPVDLVDDLPLVHLGGRRASRLYAPAKRAFDLALASAAAVVALPLLAWCALRIRLDSPGPVFFTQTRIGKDGRPFRMWKLRTMRADAEAYARAPSERGDSRVTRYGAWLRATSLDELPQLWNVLRGDMSLVGPRPEMPFIVETYDDWQRRRLMARPGLTGLWQILGRKDLPMHENLQYDFYYLHNRSFLFDLSILIRTLVAVFTARGAF